MKPALPPTVRKRGLGRLKSCPDTKPLLNPQQQHGFDRKGVVVDFLDGGADVWLGDGFDREEERQRSLGK